MPLLAINAGDDTASGQFSDIATTAVKLHNISRFSRPVAPWHQGDIDWWAEVEEVTYVSCVPHARVNIKIIMLLCM